MSPSLASLRSTIGGLSWGLSSSGLYFGLFRSRSAQHGLLQPTVTTGSMVPILVMASGMLLSIPRTLASLEDHSQKGARASGTGVSLVAELPLV